MNSPLQNRCDLFVTNAEVFRKAFPLEHGMIATASSSLYSCANRNADIQFLREARELLRSKANIFSSFRSTLELLIVTKLSMSNAPSAYFDHIELLLHQLKGKRLFTSEFLTLTASVLSDYLDTLSSDDIVKRTKDVYEMMHKHHPLITSDEDYPYAALLAMSGLSIAQMESEIECCFRLLKSRFRSGNTAQAISCILALNPLPSEEKCQKVIALHDAMKDSGHPFAAGIDRSLLGILIALDLPIAQIVAEITEADNYLKQKKGFTNFTMGSSQRRLYAALAVISEHCISADTASVSVVNTVLAEQIAIELCLMIACTSSAAAAAVTSAP